MTETTIVGFAKLLTNVGTFLQTFRRNRQDGKKEALNALYTALNETTKYIRLLPQKGQSVKKEERIASLWSLAGVALRLVDPQLSDRCILKSEYWHDPEAWSVRQIKELGIQLVDVRLYARQLLKED